jgi:hypothetical protein
MVGGRRRLIGLAVLALVVGVPACSDDGADDGSGAGDRPAESTSEEGATQEGATQEGASGDDEPRISAASPQDVAGGSIVVDEVHLPEPGFVCVFSHTDTAEEVSWEPLGGSGLLDAGTHCDLEVPLDGPPATAVIAVSPCADSDGDGTYRFGSDDVHRFVDQDGSGPVQALVEVAEA